VINFYCENPKTQDLLEQDIVEKPILMPSKIIYFIFQECNEGY
jgi:hypothetical protein